VNCLRPGITVSVFLRLDYKCSSSKSPVWKSEWHWRTEMRSQWRSSVPSASQLSGVQHTEQLSLGLWTALQGCWECYRAAGRVIIFIYLYPPPHIEHISVDCGCVGRCFTTGKQDESAAIPH